MSPETPLLFDEGPVDSLYEGPAEELAPSVPEFDLFSRFALATLRKRGLQRELKEVEKELARVTPLLLNFFDAHPESGGMTVHDLVIFKRSQIYARAKEGSSAQEVCDALRASDLGHYVHDAFYSTELSKYVRELEERYADQLSSGEIEETGDLLPARLAEVLNVEPTVSVVGQRKRKQPKGQ